MRWIRFNAVGLIGVALQLGLLAGLLREGVHYLAATSIAVEATLLHNFLWHERWTWRDRPAGANARLTRLWRFHALNGAISLGGNLLLMEWLSGHLGMPALAANAIAIAVSATLNFAAGDRLVFRNVRSSAPPLRPSAAPARRT
ncbi:MAG TPA: GtrA family protein [Vicinamibacterales bacterium]|nr:GtrA family protein [Vicinamibacterales bacterium]